MSVAAKRRAAGPVHRREPGPPPRILVLLVAVAALLAWGAYVIGALLNTRTELVDARLRGEEGLAGLLAGDPGAARDHLGAAAAGFARGERRLTGLAMLPLRAVPVVRANVRAASAIAAAGARSATAGEEVAGAVADLPGGVRAMAPRNGAIPIEPIESLVPALRRAAELIDEAQRLAAGAPDRGLIGPVAAARAEVVPVLEQAAELVSPAATLAAALPDFLGADRPKRYFFGASNPAELRGTGGLVGAYAILTIDTGHIDISGFEPVQDLETVPPEEAPAPSADYAARYNRYGGAGFWLNINMTPDFPSAAQAIEDLYQQVTGDALDGTITADPFALAGLLALAGPAEIPGVGDTVDADTVVGYVANEAYGVITDFEERKRLLGAVAATALEGFLRGDDAHPFDVLRVLGESARGGHLLLHARDENVQAALDEVGVTGRLPDPEGDFLAIAVNNAVSNKADFYTSRTVHHRVALREGGGAAVTAAVELTNDTPRDGMPAYVIGPNRTDAAAGENRSLVSLYCAVGCEYTGFRRSLGRIPFREEEELGHPVFTTMVVLASGEGERVELDWTVDDVWETRQGGQGVYHLTVRGQPTIRPTRLILDVVVPEGMAVLEASKGFTIDDETARWDGEEPFSGTFEVVFAPARETGGGASAWQRLRRFLNRPVFPHR